MKRIYLFILNLLQKRFIKFALVGSSGVIVNMGFLYILKEVARIDLKFSSILAIEISILFNFFLNNIWTWSDRSTSPFLHRIAKYHLSVIFSAYVINWGSLMILTTWFHWNYLIANLIGILIGTILNYLLNDVWTFKKSGN